MPDTVRTLAQLQTLLADQTIGAISPQDVRDFLVSNMGCYAHIYTEDGSTAQATFGTTPVLVTSFADDGANGGANNATADQANNKLTIGTGGDGVYLVASHGTFTGTASTQFDFELRAAAALTNFKSQVALNATPDEGQWAVLGLVTGLTAGDDLELYVVADGASKTITISQASLFAKRVA